MYTLCYVVIYFNLQGLLYTELPVSKGSIRNESKLCKLSNGPVPQFRGIHVPAFRAVRLSATEIRAFSDLPTLRNTGPGILFAANFNTSGSNSWVFRL